MNSEFSFCWTSCLTKAEETSLPYYLPIAGGRIIGFIPFPRVLVLCEMQSVSSRIWTRVAMFISYDDNHYTTVTLFNQHLKGIHTFPNGICPKINVIEWLEFELFYFENVGLRFICYTMGTPHLIGHIRLLTKYYCSRLLVIFCYTLCYILHSCCNMVIIENEGSRIALIKVWDNRGSLNKFPDFFRMGTFIDSTHIKLVPVV